MNAPAREGRPGRLEEQFCTRSRDWLRKLAWRKESSSSLPDAADSFFWHLHSPPGVTCVYTPVTVFALLQEDHTFFVTLFEEGQIFFHTPRIEHKK
jgi:hypothetical protein